MTMALPDILGMTVHDMVPALRFYLALGLDIPTGVEGEAYVEVITPNGYRLSWITVEMLKGIYADWYEPTGHRMTLAFKGASPAKVYALHQAVVAAGFASYKEPWDAFGGQRYVVMVDHDGNLVDLFDQL